MNILVTGATGLVGSKLCVELLKMGHSLTVIGRGEESAFRTQFTLPTQYIRWSDLTAEQGHLSTMDAVFHLAGESIAGARWSKSRKQSIFDSRVKTTETLVRAFEAIGHFPKVFVSASAIGYYSDRGDEKLSEESKPGSGFLAEVCRAWEKASKPLESKCRVVRVRIGVVLDSEGGFLSEMLPLFRKRLGGPVGSGRQWLSWIHSADLISLLIEILRNDRYAGVVNGVSPEPVTNSEFGKFYSSQLKVFAGAPAPAFALKLALGEMSSLALNSTRVSPKVASKLGFQFCYSGLKKALAELYTWMETPSDRLLIRRHWLPRKKEAVFQFFSDAKNLEKITPSWLNFKIDKMSTEVIRKGTLLDYRLSLHGLPMKWRTEILEWKPTEEFVDLQISGPYSKWHHTHSFEDVGGGTLMTDQVTYRLPMGSFGSLLASRFVAKDVAKIFQFRKATIQSLIDSKEI